MDESERQKRAVSEVRKGRLVIVFAGYFRLCLSNSNASSLVRTHASTNLTYPIGCLERRIAMQSAN